MALLLQLHGDLPERFPGHERRLYVFACRKRVCGQKEGSIRVVRGSRVTKTTPRARKPASESQPEAKAPAAPPVDIGASLFGSTSLSLSSTMTPGSNPFSMPTFASTSALKPSSTTGSNSTTPMQNPFSSSSTCSGFPPLSTLAAKPAQNPAASQISHPPLVSAPDIDNLAPTFASALALDLPPPSPLPSPEPFPPPSSPLLPQPYPLLHLDAEYETLSCSRPATPAPLTADFSTEPSSASSNTTEKDDPNAYESELDSTFQTFADRLAQNPEQVLRYAFGGEPLLYSRIDPIGRLLFPASVTNEAHLTTKASVRTQTHDENVPSKDKQRAFQSVVPRCAQCHAPRIYECQLVPGAITELETDQSDESASDGAAKTTAALEGMEWGTIIIGVCSKDCLPQGAQKGSDKIAVGYTEEWAGVQWEGRAGA